MSFTFYPRFVDLDESDLTPKRLEEKFLDALSYLFEHENFVKYGKEILDESGITRFPVKHVPGPYDTPDEEGDDDPAATNRRRMLAVFSSFIVANSRGRRCESYQIAYARVKEALAEHRIALTKESYIRLLKQIMFQLIRVTYVGISYLETNPWRANLESFEPGSMALQLLLALAHSHGLNINGLTPDLLSRSVSRMGSPSPRPGSRASYGRPPKLSLAGTDTSPLSEPLLPHSPVAPVGSPVPMRCGLSSPDPMDHWRVRLASQEGLDELAGEVDGFSFKPPTPSCVCFSWLQSKEKRERKRLASLNVQLAEYLDVKPSV